MAYCTEAQITSEFREIGFDAGSKVTDTYVSGLITETDAEINAAISGVYKTPVSNAVEGFLVLQRVALNINVYKIERILRKTGVEKISDKVEKELESRIKDAMDTLEKIRNGELELIGAEKQTSGGGAGYNADVTAFFNFGDDKATDKW